MRSGRLVQPEGTGDIPDEAGDRQPLVKGITPVCQQSRQDPGNSTADQFYGEKYKVIRGGGWFEEPDLVVTYERNAADPNITANDDLGFRCVQ